jgi:hypothetical protein
MMGFSALNPTYGLTARFQTSDSNRHLHF